MTGYSMHEIAEKRNCRSCAFGDDKALDFNKSAYDKEQWAKSQPWCKFAFRLDLSEDGLKCNSWRAKEIKK